MALQRLIYHSHATDISDPGLVFTILQTSIRNNEKAGIGGVLFLAKDMYIQVLEGETDAIDTTFDRISQDRRHDRVTVVGRGDIQSRAFPQWAMHDLTPNVEDDPSEFLGQDLTAKLLLGKCLKYASAEDRWEL